MSRIFGIVAILCLLASSLFAQTTPIYGFNIPNAGTQTNTWGPLLNTNMLTLEALLSGSKPITALNVANAVQAASVSASGGVSGASGSFSGNMTSAGLIVTGAAEQALTPVAGVISWAVGSTLFANRYVTLSQNSTLNLTGMLSGGNYTLIIYQPGSGSSTYGLTLGTGCLWRVANGGHGAIALTPSVGSVDLLAFFYDGTYCNANLIPNLN